MYYFAAPFNWEINPPIEKIYDMLYQLGLRATNCGFFYVSYAIWLLIQEPERLELVTKWLYPDIANHYDTSCSAVLAGIRRILNRVWKTNTDLLEEWASTPLLHKPEPAQFLKILMDRASQTI